MPSYMRIFVLQSNVFYSKYAGELHRGICDEKCRRREAARPLFVIIDIAANIIVIKRKIVANIAEMSAKKYLVDISSKLKALLAA